MIIGDKFGNGGHLMKIPAMEDSGSPGPGGAGAGGGGAGSQANGQAGDGRGAPSDEAQPRPAPNYSIPGILHFLQHEWARFELERSQWEVDRAELEVSVVAAIRDPLTATTHRSHRFIRPGSPSCRASARDWTT